eukprot:SAG31_NODE_136_length_23089_cov_8.825924_3_plen_467_part_00
MAYLHSGRAETVGVSRGMGYALGLGSTLREQAEAATVDRLKLQRMLTAGHRDHSTMMTEWLQLAQPIRASFGWRLQGIQRQPVPIIVAIWFGCQLLPQHRSEHWAPAMFALWVAVRRDGPFHWPRRAADFKPAFSFAGPATLDRLHRLTRGLGATSCDAVDPFEVELRNVQDDLRVALGKELHKILIAAAIRQQRSHHKQDATPQQHRLATALTPRTNVIAPAQLQRQAKMPEPAVRDALRAAGVSVERTADKQSRELAIRVATAKESLTAGWNTAVMAMEADNKQPSGRNLQTVYGSGVPRKKTIQNARYAATLSKQEMGGAVSKKHTERLKTTTPCVVSALQHIGREELLRSAETLLADRWNGVKLADMATQLVTGFWTALARLHRSAFLPQDPSKHGEAHWLPTGGRILKVLLTDITGVAFAGRNRDGRTPRSLQTTVKLPDGSDFDVSGQLPDLSVCSELRG